MLSLNSGNCCEAAICLCCCKKKWSIGGSGDYATLISRCSGLKQLEEHWPGASNQHSAVPWLHPAKDMPNTIIHTVQRAKATGSGASHLSNPEYNENHCSPTKPLIFRHHNIFEILKSSVRCYLARRLRYQNAGHGHTQPLSVHLCSFPAPDYHPFDGQNLPS